MKGVIKKYTEMSLILRIFIGLVIGATLGLVAPGLSFITIFGKVFVGALKAVAPVLVFGLVSSAIAKAHSHIGARFRTVIILYMLSTLLAAVIALAGAGADANVNSKPTSRFGNGW